MSSKWYTQRDRPAELRICTVCGKARSTGAIFADHSACAAELAKRQEHHEQQRITIGKRTQQRYLSGVFANKLKDY